MERKLSEMNLEEDFTAGNTQGKETLRGKCNVKYEHRETDFDCR